LRKFFRPATKNRPSVASITDFRIEASIFPAAEARAVVDNQRPSLRTDDIARRNSCGTASMPNELPIPKDWQHLIEKRAGNERRSSGRATKSGPAADSAKPPIERRRKDRRKRK
jgi:hypothetical protein